MSNDIETTDSTMQSSAEELANIVVGHRIVSVEQTKASSQERWYAEDEPYVLTLDNGQRVRIHNTSDCCAYTALQAFLLHPDKVDHVITGVKTEDDYQTWHIFADMGDVLTMTVGWSEGNPFYYSYGFVIEVVPE